MDASKNKELQASLYIGAVKLAITEHYIYKSMDEHVSLYEKPDVKVVTKKAFKVGSMKLVGLSNNVGTQVANNTADKGTAVLVGHFFDSKDGPLIGVVRPHLNFPKSNVVAGTASKGTDVFIVPYWGVDATFDCSKANCEKRLVEDVIKVGKTTYTIKVPYIINTKALVAGDRLYVQKVELANAGANEDEGGDGGPVAKKHCTLASKFQGGKGKGGKGKLMTK